ncbi:MAG: pilus assembly protein [Actinobacteria bacterium]|nr:pilus assembly protein [Actinomycetota bacterium]
MIRRKTENHTPGRSAPATRRRRDRGAVFIEFALIVPLLLVVAMGIVDYGLDWKWANDVNAAARDGARVGTSAPVFSTSDRSVLLAIASSLTPAQQNAVRQIIVYSTTDPAGAVPAGCLSITNTTGSASSPGTKAGVSGCNVYGAGTLKYVVANPGVDTPWINSAGNGCDSTDLDYNWCPASRARSLTSGTFDYLGVYIRLSRPSVTKFGIGDQTIARRAVFRFEPAFGGS